MKEHVVSKSSEHSFVIHGVNDSINAIDLSFAHSFDIINLITENTNPNNSKRINMS